MLNNLPVKMAKGASSRKSRRVKRVPWAILCCSMNSLVTSNVMGILHTRPLGNRQSLTTLVFGQLSSQLNKPIVLRLCHETFQGGETTVEYQFQITKLPFIQGDARQPFRFSEQGFALRFVSCNQIFQLAAMRCILFRGRLRRVVERGGVSATFAVAFCLCHF
jgi:hypothetical protein